MGVVLAWGAGVTAGVVGRAVTKRGVLVGLGEAIRLTVRVTRGDGVGDAPGAASDTMLQAATQTLMNTQIASGRHPQ